MCGENDKTSENGSQSEGSPPHVRGKLDKQIAAFEERGITPACAGKTNYINNGFQVLRDHPRMCGENVSRPQFLRASMGSPPHVRGKRTVAYISISFNGITPACAGKTLSILQVYQSKWDHPRMCGENV